MDALENAFRGAGLPAAPAGQLPWPSSDAGAVARLLAQCPAARETPLHAVETLAREASVAALHLKDERGRMGLGSFKALGAAYAIAREAEAVGTEDWDRALEGRVFVTASAGNHGLSVAAGARVFGARAVVVLAAGVPAGFAARLEGQGATVERAGASYEESMAAAEALARRHGWTLLSDSSWPGYLELPHRVMEGYLQMAAEAADALPAPPSHILLQAGVGGLAAAVAAYARSRWGDGPRIVVVEPEAAPALSEGIRAGQVVETAGPVSAMGRLDCKSASLLALHGLARDADLFVTVGEADAARAVERLAAAGYATTPSGAAGVAPLLLPAARAVLALDAASRVLCFMTERAEEP